MSGEKYLLDTNAVVALLTGNQNVLLLVQDAEWIGISIITVLEFLSFPDLAENDRDLFGLFMERVDVISLSTDDDNLIEAIISMRSARQIKLPDAIIAASAVSFSAILVTNDDALLRLDGVDTRAF